MIKLFIDTSTSKLIVGLYNENKKLSITSNEATMDNKVCSIKVGCSYDIYDKLF